MEVFCWRLCMRATADYWVNGFDGIPLFKVNCAVNPGMIKVLEEEIVPFLEKKVPNQPSEADLEKGFNPMQIERHMEIAENLRAEIEKETTEIDQLKAKRKMNTKHVEIKERPEADQFMKLANRSKHFIDTLKIIAYRAETAMADAVREPLGEHHQDEARAYVRKLYTNEANLRPAPSSGTLLVEIHALATPKENRILRDLCQQLNETETLYPGTNLRMNYKLVSV